MILFYLTVKATIKGGDRTLKYISVIHLPILYDIWLSKNIYNHFVLKSDINLIW